MILSKRPKCNFSQKAADRICFNQRCTIYPAICRQCRKLECEQIHTHENNEQRFQKWEEVEKVAEEMENERREEIRSRIEKYQGRKEKQMKIIIANLTQLYQQYREKVSFKCQKMVDFNQVIKPIHKAVIEGEHQSLTGQKIVLYVNQKSNRVKLNCQIQKQLQFQNQCLEKLFRSISVLIKQYDDLRPQESKPFKSHLFQVQQHIPVQKIQQRNEIQDLDEKVITLLLEAQSLQQKSQVDLSIQKYKQILQIQPLSITIYNEIASLYISEERYSEALEQLQLALRIQKNNPASNMLKADIFALRLEEQKALKQYEEVLKIDPNNSKAYEGKGDMLLKQSKHKAIECYNKAIELEGQKGDSKLLLKRAKALHESNQSQRAIQDLIYIKKKKDQDHELNYRANLMLAKIYQTLKQHEKALELYNSCILQKGSDESFFGKAKMCFQLKKYEQAIQNFKPMNYITPQAYYIQANCFYKLNQFSQALVSIDLAISQMQGSQNKKPQYYKLRGQVNKQLGNKEASQADKMKHRQLALANATQMLKQNR